MDDKIATALRLLPTCERCKRLRRKCDTELPACHLCAATQSECVFRDYVLQETVSRRHVKVLLERWILLKEGERSFSAGVRNHDSMAPDASVSPTPSALGSLAVSHQSNTRNDFYHEVSNLQSANPLSLGNGHPLPSFDGHYPIPGEEKTEFVFFGSSSAIALSAEVIFHACPSSKAPNQASIYNRISGKAKTPLTINNSLNDMNPSYEIIESLARTYISSINVIFPLLAVSTIEEDLKVLRAAATTLEVGPTPSNKAETHSLFRILMVCCIASANQLRHKPWLLPYQHKLYSWALKHAEEVTSEISDRSFQALMLAVIFYLFHPQKGDIWMLLNSASRLCVVLGYHMGDKPKLGTEGDNTSRRTAFWTFYKIEHMIGQQFGRPSDSLESIMIIDYPDIVCITEGGAGHDAVQQDVGSQLYRLASVRSEIFRNIYLPSTNPTHDIQWFRIQYFKVLLWYREAIPEDCPPGIGTISCDVAFHSTVIFLYQNSLMSALSETKSSGAIPRLRDLETDNYFSACQIIRIYEQIFNADESSDLADYPIMSTNIYEIYTAGLTILAHCLISIDGRTQTIASYRNESLNDTVTLWPINYSSVHEVSASCIALLAQAAILWPAMDGMLSIYKEVAGVVLPQLIRKGLA